MKRLLGGAALALALTVGIGVAPVSAASDTVVTVKGHVRSSDGKALAKITVSASCGCNSSAAFSTGNDKTSTKGYFSFRVQKRYAQNITFTDPSHEYLSAAAAESKLRTSGTTYILTTTMKRAAEIAGTVRDDSGLAVGGVSVRAYDAVTGVRYLGGTNTRGHYHLYVPAGGYKIRLVGSSFSYDSAWYGQADSAETSPTVTATAGAKTSKVDAVIAKRQSISGDIRIDGTQPIASTKEQIIVILSDSVGHVLERMKTTDTFGFTKLYQGTYGLTFQPAKAGADFFTPVTMPVILGPGASVTGLNVMLRTTSLSASDKRDVALTMLHTPAEPKKGRPFRSMIELSSYGEVADGTVTIYANGSEVAKRAVPASGKVTWATRFTGIDAGTVTITASFSGTETTQAIKERKLVTLRVAG